MSTIAVIATHDRIAITTATIKQMQTHDVRVMVVCSEESEYDYYDKSDCYVCMAPNHPLGSKWQHGVDYARKLNPDKLIICGSDDILSHDFLDAVQINDHDFTGLRSWYIYNQGKLHRLNYIAANNLPLGGGRVYSKRLLDACDWKLFDTKASALLDDRGWEIARHCSSIHLINTPEILAVKGDWPVMNKFTLKHKNIGYIETLSGNEAARVLKEKFNYDI